MSTGRQEAQNLFNSTHIKIFLQLRFTKEEFKSNTERNRDSRRDLFNDVALGEIIESENEAVRSGGGHGCGSDVLEEGGGAESERTGERQNARVRTAAA